MTKLDALKSCVWLEYFAMEHSHGTELAAITQRIGELKEYIAKSPDELELQIEVRL